MRETYYLLMSVFRWEYYSRSNEELVFVLCVVASSSSSQAPVSLEFVNCHLTYGPLPRFNQKTAFFNLKLQAFFVLRN